MDINTARAQWDSEQLEHATRRQWNGSDSDEQAALRLVQKGFFAEVPAAKAHIDRRFAVYARHLGCAPFPIRALDGSSQSFHDVRGLAPERPVDVSKLDPAYAAWKGLIGQGAQLRAIVAAQRAAKA
jgi:hypothetical protein